MRHKKYLFLLFEIGVIGPHMSAWMSCSLYNARHWLFFGMDSLCCLGVSISGSVRFWIKIINQTEIIFFQVFEQNWTENRFEPTIFGSVWFFSLPNQFKPKLFQLSFFTDHIFSGILSSSCSYFHRSVLSQHDFFLKWLGMYDEQKERTEVIWLEKKTKERLKDSLNRSSSAHHPSSAKLDFEFLFSQYQHQGEHVKAFYWFNMIIFFGYMCMKN
jgi:hypothetical protein